MSHPRSTFRHEILLSLAVLSLYAITLSYGFVWDDMAFVERNPALGTLSSLPGAFLKADGALEGFWNPYYRPVTTATFALGRLLWGTNPAGFHGENVLFHLGASLAFLALARRLLPSEGWAFAAALLFALHPASTEPVAWISARGDLLCGLFSALALLLALRHLEGGGRADLVLSAAALAAALLSKEVAVVLPVLAFLLARRGRGEGSRSPLPWTWGAVTAAFLVLRAVVLPAEDWGSSPPAERLAVSGVALLSYVRYALFPVGLKVFHPALPAPSLASLPVVASWGILLALSGAAAAAYRARPVTAVGAAWFLLALLPVSGLVTPMYPTPMADRYLYVPLMGALLAVGDLASALPLPGRFLRSPLPGRVATAAAAAAFFLLSAARIPAWTDGLSLWTTASRVAPESDIVLCNLGVSLIERGRWDEARLVLEGAAIQGGATTDLLANLALVHANRGDFGPAEACIRESVRKAPLNPSYLKTAAWVLEERGKRGEALAMLREAARRSGPASRAAGLLALLEEWEGREGRIPVERFNPL